jgi:hypothetical protein
VVPTRKIRSKAILIGYDPDGRCVYNDIMDLSDYYEREHVWDSAAPVQKLKLQRVTGYLFNSDGELDQEFESVFDLATGIFKRGRTRFADGTIRVHGDDA